MRHHRNFISYSGISFNWLLRETDLTTNLSLLSNDYFLAPFKRLIGSYPGFLWVEQNIRLDQAGWRSLLKEQDTVNKKEMSLVGLSSRAIDSLVHLQIYTKRAIVDGTPLWVNYWRKACMKLHPAGSLDSRSGLLSIVERWFIHLA